MEELKNKINDKFTTLGWNNTDGVWSNEKTVVVNQGTIVINGHQIQQRGEEKKLLQLFEITGNCEIEDVKTQQVDISLMCRWEIVSNGVTEGYLEINIDDYDTFNMYCNKIFGV